MLHPSCVVPSDDAESGWSGLFWDAFRRSKSAMVLVDDERRLIEVNGALLQLLGHRRSDLIGRHVYEFVADRPFATADEWRAMLHRPQFTGAVDLMCADGRCMRVEFAGHPEMVTGRQLVLGVILAASARGRRSAGSVGAESDHPRLTPRELDVINLVALGLSGREIAQELQIAHDTVRTHVRNAMTKTDARSRAHLVAKTLGEGLLWSRDG
ncbi:MAG TPA: PAS and helix-turn-helix domain-containing protein [Solirubrobacteraceae bacterium]|nr:PAS and helix-turn-helix domain-containing protein [Solirubrobacteraceae bacterium]